VPRKGHVARRDVLPDPIYNDVKVAKLINNVMEDGKKGVAQKIVYEAFDMMKEKSGQNPLETFHKALENVMPMLEVKARRVGGANYQVPIEVRPERRQALGLRWLVSYAQNRSERTMKERLAGELLDASNNAGNAYKKKEDMHKMADANRAFAHYKW
jgi:small subunit ribosomal protein S7